MGFPPPSFSTVCVFFSTASSSFCDSCSTFSSFSCSVSLRGVPGLFTPFSPLPLWVISPASLRYLLNFASLRLPSGSYKVFGEVIGPLSLTFQAICFTFVAESGVRDSGESDVSILFSSPECNVLRSFGLSVDPFAPVGWSCLSDSLSPNFLITIFFVSLIITGVVAVGLIWSSVGDSDLLGTSSANVT